MAHPNNASYDIDTPMMLVYADLLGLISMPVLGGYNYVSKFMDHFSRWHEIYLIKSKPKAVDTLHLFNKTVSILLGRRVERLCCDKESEYTAKVFKKLCNDTGIKIKFTITVTPQRNSVSEK